LIEPGKPIFPIRSLLFAVGVALAASATAWPVIAAPAAWLLTVLLPGRVLLAICGLDRDLDRTGRLLLGSAMALAIMPVLINPVWHWTNARWPLLAVLGALNLAGIAICWRRQLRGAIASAAESMPKLIPNRRTWWLAAAIVALVLVATIGPYWPGSSTRGPVPSNIHDYVKHHAVLFSMERQPLPLGNPFFADEAAGPVYYYHFFYLIPATVRAIAGGPSIELAFGVHSALVALATIGLFYLLAWRIHGPGAATLAATLASFVGGLDVLAVLVLRMRVITLDAWADHVVRIHAFINQMMWSPQNVLGVTAVLLGVYVWSARAWWRGWLGLGPLLIAALVGTSVWVAIPSLLGLVIFGISEAVRVRGDRLARWPRLRGLLVVAALALMITLPTLRNYLEMSQRHGKGLTVLWPHQWHALLGRFVPPGPLANLLDLPWVLAIELGPLLMLPILLSGERWRQSLRDPGLRWLAISALVAVAGYVTVRSHFQYNDFGQKTMLVAMSAGVLLAAGAASSEAARARPWNPLGWQFDGLRAALLRRPVQIAIGCILFLGLPVALFEVPVTAARRFVDPAGRMSAVTPSRAATHFAEAGSYQFLREELPPDAIIQPFWGTSRVDLMQLSRRQLGVMELETDTMVFHPRRHTQHTLALIAVRQAFGPGTDGPTARALLAEHHITHVFVGIEERQRFGELPQFQDPQSFTEVYADPVVTVYALTGR
jgi:hypothetical protein